MPGRILLIEYEEEMREFICKILSEARYDVTSPVDSYVGLELAGEGDFDLIAVEDKMPLISGTAFAEALGDEDIHSPLLLLSDALTESRREELKNLGIQSVIEKPFQVDNLLQVVETLLQTS